MLLQSTHSGTQTALRHMLLSAKKNRTRLLINGVLLAILFIIGTPATAQFQQSENDSVPDNIAIDGYSPVSYFEKGRPERGKPEFSVEYEGKIYYLTSAEQVTRFKKNPERYKPLFDVCPYSLTLGRKVAIDPTRFKLVAGRLLLFHNSDELDGLKEWNKRGNDRALLNEAKRQYEFYREDITDSTPGDF